MRVAKYELFFFDDGGDDDELRVVVSVYAYFLSQPLSTRRSRQNELSSKSTVL